MQNPNHRPNQLEERINAFAASVISLSSKLPRNTQGRHICDQILRSGTATAANYGEARAAESRSDFIHKLKIVSKELNETAVWLEIIVKSFVIPAETVVAILTENRELCRIISSSIRTARAATG